MDVLEYIKPKKIQELKSSVVCAFKSCWDVCGSPDVDVNFPMDIHNMMTLSKEQWELLPNNIWRVTYIYHQSGKIQF